MQQPTYGGEANPSPKGVNATIANLWNSDRANPEERVGVRVETVGDEVVITVDAPFYNDPAPPAPPGSMDQLWDYEVVEVFFLGRSNRYLEIEMSPHGHFLVLKLHGARNLVETMIPIDYHAGQVKVGNVTRWTGVARIPKTLMPDGPYYWNAYSIHGVDENRRYLSLYPVPGPGFHDDAPDFHRIHCFRPIDLGFTSTEAGWLGQSY